MAAVKIALCLYYDKEIERMLEAKMSMPIYRARFDRDRYEFWKQIEMKAVEKLPSLPNSLSTKVFKFIRAFDREIMEWVRDHQCLLRLSFIGCHYTCKSILCWKADGTIEKMQTAKKLVQHRDLNLETRFAVACTYYLEDEVLAFWHGDKKVHIRSIARNRTNAAVRFWIKRLQRRHWRKKSWNVMVNSQLKNPSFRRSDIKLRVSSFFQYLSLEGKKNYFLYLLENSGHRDDYPLCMQVMNETERMELISEYPRRSLYLCLDWPFQSLFIDMANQLWSHMTPMEFEVILMHLIFHFLLPGLDVFDYAGLFKEFWHQSPTAFKETMKKNMRLFNVIDLVLNYDEKSTSLSLPET
ncbi:hypothetical protein AVEN_262062-1, partial [Araneus ventricosus]